MYGKRRRLRALILALGFPIVGCKPPAKPAAAEVKTLDNFAAGARVRTNSCAASPEQRMAGDFVEPIFAAPGERIKVDPSIVGAIRDELKAEVRESLTAVPAAMQVAFLAMGGVIDVNPETNKRCTRVFRKDGAQKTSDQELDAMTGCFELRALASLSEAERAELKRGTRKGDGGTMLRINIVPERKEIRHQIVRAFGFVFAQVFSRVTPASDDMVASGYPLRFDKRVESFKVANLKIRLAQNFLGDMIESSVFDLKALEPMLGAGAADQIRANFERLKRRGKIDDAIEANFAGVPPGAPKFADEDLLSGVSYLYRSETGPLTDDQRRVRMVRFVDFVFAEFYDSIKCRAWGAYPAPDVIASVKAGKADRDEFLRSAENTLRIAQDFFPHTYAMFAEVDREMSDVTMAIAKASPFKNLLSKSDGGAAGLALAGDPLEALAQALGGTETEASPLPSPAAAFKSAPAGAPAGAPAAKASYGAGGMNIMAMLGPLLAQAGGIQGLMSKLKSGGGGRSGGGGGGKGGGGGGGGGEDFAGGEEDYGDEMSGGGSGGGGGC